MYAGKVAPAANREDKEKRIIEARLEKTPNTPPRMAKMPATIMEVEARGAADDMHKSYSRETSGKERNADTNGA